MRVFKVICDKYPMLIKMYVNDQLIETVEVPGPGYSPQQLMAELAQHHKIRLNDQIRFVPVNQSDTA